MNYSDDSVLLNEVIDVMDYSNECDSFWVYLESRCVNEMEGLLYKNLKRKDLVSSIEWEFVFLNKEMEIIYMEC